MRDLNIDFMDLYKEVDRFIRDAYGSDEGVSEYIRNMESLNISGRRHVSSWSDDYAKLKRMRWIRNQLAHEVGYDSDICDETDYDWLAGFEDRLYSANDPVSLLRKAETAEIQNREEQRRAYRAQEREQHSWQASYAYPQQQYYQKPKRKTLWQIIKGLFSGDI